MHEMARRPNFVYVFYEHCLKMLWPYKLDCKLRSYAADLKMKYFKCMYIGDEAFKAGLLIHSQWACCLAFGPVIYCIYREVAYGRTYERPHG